MIKLVALDMDGTLLNNTNQITPKTAQIIKQMQKMVYPMHSKPLFLNSLS
ncbi:HAD family hydrolase [Cellulosilyticum sp. I15G10I2]|nr:HAD hydrolase family protein [Cellulosilyticum sp. I15G10I2]